MNHIQPSPGPGDPSSGAGATQDGNTKPTADQLTEQAVIRLLQGELDRERKYLDFAQNQMKSDREFFTGIFNKTYRLLAFCGVLIVTFVSGYVIFLAGRTAREVEDLARSSMKQTVQDVQKDVAKELKSKVDQAFRDENVAKVVDEAAKRYTMSEMTPAIRSEVSAAVNRQSPRIASSIADEAKRAVSNASPEMEKIVDRQVTEQVGALLSRTNSVLELQELAVLAKSDSRLAFDKLVALEKSPDPKVASLARQVVESIVFQKRTEPEMSYPTDREYPVSEWQGRLFAIPVDLRLMALYNFPHNVPELVPVLMKIIERDVNLEVQVNAIRRLNREAGTEFQFPYGSAIRSWWEKNKNKYPPYPAWAP